MTMQVLKSYLAPLTLVLLLKHKNSAIIKDLCNIFNILLKFYEFEYFGNRRVDPLQINLWTMFNLSLISSTESPYCWFGVFEAVSEAVHDSVDQKLQNIACSIFDENSIFRKIIFWDVILGWKKSFEKMNTQMTCEFIVISLLLGGQFWCSFRQFVC